MSDVKTFRTTKEFRQFLRKLIKVAWPNDAACCRELGVDQSALHRYLKDDRPSAELERKLLKRLNIEVKVSNEIKVLSVDLFPRSNPEKVNF